MGKGLFVIGTGTDVGKTYITALLSKKLQESGVKTAYYKAAMSGNARGADGRLLAGDALFVKQTAALSQPVQSMCPYVYEHAYSPHLAAKLEGNPVELNVVQHGYAALSEQYSYVTVEGSGGIVCPIRFDKQKIGLEDIVRGLGLPCLLVADAGLGTINSIVLTAFYLRAHHIPVQGIVLNRFHPDSVLEQDNRKMCEALTGLPVLACVQPDATEIPMSLQVLTSLYGNTNLIS